MKVQFNTNLLLWSPDDEPSWLDEMGFESEDCGIFLPIVVDYIDYVDGDNDGRVSIDGIEYSFDLEGIFDPDDDEEFPLFYILD